MKLLMVLVFSVFFLLAVQSAASQLSKQITGYATSEKNLSFVYLEKFSAVDDIPACCFVKSEKQTFCGIVTNKTFTFPVYLTGLYSVAFTTEDGPENYFESIDIFFKHVSQPHLENFIVINQPQFGDIRSDAFRIEVSLQSSFTYDTAVLEADGLREFYGVLKLTSANFIDIIGVEPGSWFFHLTPAVTRPAPDGTEHLQMGFPTFGYVEYVLSEESIREQRRFHKNKAVAKNDGNTHYTAYFPDRDYEPQELLLSDTNSNPEWGEGTSPIRVCIWSTERMDGQRRIWLSQLQHMDPTRFQFTWLIGLPDGETLRNDSKWWTEERSVLKYLRPLHGVRVRDSPFNGFAVSLDQQREVSSDDGPSVEQVWGGDQTKFYRYIHQRLVAANFVVSDVSPAWCRRAFETLVRALEEESCDLLVYGNSRGFGSDIMLVDGARLLGIPTVAELVNLYIDGEVLPSVVVAPSTYAAEHESIQNPLRTQLQPRLSRVGQAVLNSSDLTRSVVMVVPPSVDTEYFHPNKFNQTLSRDNCPVVKSLKFERKEEMLKSNYWEDDWLNLVERGKNRPCFVVGFFARLSVEKNPGLFIQAAKQILQQFPYTRFHIIGDGPARSSLEELARRLEIDWAFSFLGWVLEGLPEALAALDVVVNPSLRGWSETFCIANIEAMSAGVPLVTFAVGGIGEYVVEPKENQNIEFITLVDGQNSDEGFNSDPNGQLIADFVLSKNAVVVNRAKPEAVAGAVLLLLSDPGVRRDLAMEGRRSVESFFSVARQMRQYSALYSSLFTFKTIPQLEL